MKTPLITPNALLQLLETAPVVLIDARPSKDAYRKEHLKAALHVDLDTQLSDIKADAAAGGRHPLPTPQRFAELLTALGISPSSHVVVYDAMSGANAASRFWWMLKAIGHAQVQVLDGGYNAALEAGFALSSEPETVALVEPYPISDWQLPSADIAAVDAVRLNKDYMVIDVRSKPRYDGLVEPIDLVAGHIPGAVNEPFEQNLDADGYYLSPETLKNKYLGLLAGRKPENVLVHCGSGVTACHTILAFAYAGLELPKLYVGSWSEWSRNGKEIASLG